MSGGDFVQGGFCPFPTIDMPTRPFQERLHTLHTENAINNVV